MIRIYADIVQNPTVLGCFQTFGGQCTWTDELICGAILICGLSHLNQITSLGKCMLNNYKRMSQNCAPKVAIMVISRLFNSLIFMYDIYTIYYLMKLS